MDHSLPMASQTPSRWLALAVTGWLLSATLGACSSNGNAAKYVAAGAIAPSPAGSAAGNTGGTSTPAAGTAAVSGTSFASVMAIFSMHKCLECHATAATGGGLVIPAGLAAAHAALVGAQSTAAGLCAGKIYVVAGRPDASLLYEKLAMPAPSCGARMPMGLTPLNATELATVQSWIAAGALNN